MLTTLLALTLLAPDAGSFSDSALGLQRAGQNVVAHDERWVSGLAPEPLLVRVERRGDELAIAFYAQEKLPPDAGAPRFVERARFGVPMARQLDLLQERDLGAAGHVLAVTAHADDPDEEPVVFTVVGAGPKVLFQGSFLRDPARDVRRLEVGPPEGFSLAEDGGAPEIDLASQTTHVQALSADGGPVEVELGRREARYAWKGDHFQAAGESYREFLPPLPLSSPAHPKLVDGKPTTSEKLAVHDVIPLALPAGSALRLLRIVPGCLGSEAEWKKGSAVRAVQLILDGHREAPIPVTFGQPVGDARIAASGEFTLGKGYGTSEMLFFFPAAPVTSIEVEVLENAKGAAKGCLAELAAY